MVDGKPKAFRTAALTLLLFSAFVHAQTTTTASISGLVTDEQGGVISGALVTIKDKSTNLERSATTDAEGRYVFANIPPGLYNLTTSAERFKTSVIAEIKAEVTKPIAQDVTLEVGEITEKVESTAGGEILLQRQDASVGNSFSKRSIMLLPNLRRQVVGILALQPGITPNGEVVGARGDQSTFSLDGIDVSDNLTGFPRTVVPTPVEGIDEFRVTVANPNVTFGRSSGGQVAFVTRRGTSEFHGSLYEYYQTSALNANSWTNNQLGQPKPFLLDNRFGGTVGGPILKDRTFFFLLYEGRRNSANAIATRVVPTSTLKLGRLRFLDTGGSVQTINPQTFDPRGIGPNPVILQLLQSYPDPNNFSVGDGFNTAGFTANFPTSVRGDLGMIKLDQKLNKRWTFDSSFSAYRELNALISQVDIVNRKGTASLPSRPRSLSLGLTGIFTPRLINEFRFGWVRDQGIADRISPRPQVAGVNIALDLASNLLDEPVDVDTLRARRVGDTVNVYQSIDNLTWTKNSHTLQAGFNVRSIMALEFRDDKVAGSLTTPVAQIGSASFNRVPASERPGFIQPVDVGRYNQLYATLLGEVENITYLATRNGQLQLNPIGTGLTTDSKLDAYEVYAADTWRISPSLSASYGLMYMWQTPPVEREGKQTILILKDTGEILNPKLYLQRKLAAAESGQFFNPDIAFLPIRDAQRKYAFDLDRTNFSPRISIAWNPEFRHRWLYTLFGNKKTVFRGGTHCSTIV